MLATQTPPVTAAIRPARRDSPRPASMVRSASGPRPNTSRFPSGIPITWPDGVLTRAATTVVDSAVIAIPAARPVELRSRLVRRRPGGVPWISGGARDAQATTGGVVVVADTTTVWAPPPPCRTPAWIAAGIH